MLDWILHLLNHPWVPWSGSGIIVAWGIVQWWLLQQRSILPARQQLAKELLQPDQMTLETLLGPGWDQHYLQQIPNLLLGMGLFITLVGLSAALFFVTRELQATHVADARQALEGLLHAASLKFLASLSGLITAFLFTWGAKRQRAQVEQQMNSLRQHMDNPLPTPPAPMWEEPTPPAEPTTEPDPPPDGMEKNMDKPVETLETDRDIQDKTPPVSPLVVRPPTVEREPVPTMPPAAKPAPAARGPRFAQLAGDYLQARQKRRTPSSARSVQQTK